ncbi:MAG: alpha/beta hydrolase family protein [Pseudomonadota bacterium]
MDYQTETFDLDNGRGDMLSARLERPTNGEVKAYGIFANCFTCEKEFFAPKRVCRALAARGVAMVRFDFTGLGKSEGDFSDTNFTTHIEDLTAIAQKLESDFGQGPELLIGHSFGGPAALAMTETTPSVRTVATIGAPKDPRHVMRHFEEHQQILEREGMIEIDVAGRKYVLKKQFAEDVKSFDVEKQTRNFKGDLFVFHDPEDDMVRYENAGEIYDRAGGAAWLVSLKGAGHMLGDIKQTAYVGNLLADWLIEGTAPTGDNIQAKTKHKTAS